MWNCVRQITVEPVLFLFMMAMFIQLPTSQMLILQKVCLTEFKANTNVCDHLDQKENQEMENIVQTKTSHWILYLQLFGAIPSAFMSLIFGASSDRLGRKLVMVLPVMGSIINGFVLILSAYFIDLSIEYLIIGALAMGFSGGFGTIFIAVTTYIADITTEENRTKRLGIMESMVFIGGTLGLLMAGLIVQKFGFPAVYVFVVVLEILILIYVGFILKESLPPLKRMKDEKDKDVSCLLFLRNSIHSALTVNFKKREGNKRKHLLLMQGITVLSVLVLSGELDLTVLFTKHQPLSWKPSLLGIYLALKNISKGLVLITVLPLYYHIRGKREPQRDIILGQIGQLSLALSLVMVSLAKTTTMMMFVPVIGSLSGLTGAIMGSLKTQLVLPTEFGAMFACGSFFDSLISLVGSLLFNTLYPATLHFWPGFSFLVMAGLVCLSLSVITYIKCSIHHQSSANHVILVEDESDAEEMDDRVNMETAYDWGGDHEKNNGLP